jgi:hypothetical protein
MQGVEHAARPKAIRELTLDDIDLPSRRITIAGHSQPLGDLTRTILLAWLERRHATWPGTANRHLLISRVSALGTEPVTADYLDKHLLLGAPLERIRRDRILLEALATSADPVTSRLRPRLGMRLARRSRPQTRPEPGTWWSATRSCTSLRTPTRASTRWRTGKSTASCSPRTSWLTPIRSWRQRWTAPWRHSVWRRRPSGTPRVSRAPLMALLASAHGLAELATSGHSDHIGRG